MIGGKIMRATMTVASPGGTLGGPSRSGRAKIDRSGEEVEVVNDFKHPLPAGARVNLTVVRGEHYIYGAVRE